MSVQGWVDSMMANLRGYLPQIQTGNYIDTAVKRMLADFLVSVQEREADRWRDAVIAAREARDKADEALRGVGSEKRKLNTCDECGKEFMPSGLKFKARLCRTCIGEMAVAVHLGTASEDPKMIKE